MTRFSRRTLTKLALGLVLMTSALGGPLLAGGAHAQLSTCRTDPIVTLSNGTKLTLYADTQDRLSDIQSVTYEVHIPTNVSVVGVQYDTYGYLEHLTVVSDQQPQLYHTYTTVTTGTPVTATAFAGVQGPVCQTAQTATMTNTTPHTLPNQFNC